jgi:aspartyl-tRNA(Asn)/glutamyl-tRNA(Gln) amidotransferase subunit C
MTPLIEESPLSNPLTAADVRKVATLARLTLSDEEVARFTRQLGVVLQYVDQLNEVDVTGVEPLVHAIEVENVLRADETTPSLPRDQALANAPKQDGKYFLVPPILGGD